MLLDFILQRAREAFLLFLLGLYLTTGTLHLLRYILDNFCYLNSDQKKLCRFPNSSALRKIGRALRSAVTLRSCQFSHFPPCYSPLCEHADPIELTSFSVFVLARVLYSFKVFVGFNETGSHVAKKISLAITLRYQAFYNQSASSNHGLSAAWLRKNALRLSQSALSNFCPACDKHHNTPLQNINTSVSPCTSPPGTQRQKFYTDERNQCPLVMWFQM